MFNLVEYMEFVEDPRDIRGKRYKLTDLLVMTIYGILNGQTDFSNISYFLKLHEDYFKELLNIDKTPSHDCLSDLFATIDPNEFMAQFVLWVEDISKQYKNSIVAIDGKAIKSARDKINKGNVPYVVSAFLTDAGISIGQVKINDGESEAKTIPKLIDLLDIRGLTVTIDAIGTQVDIIDKIKEKKAHFVLKVKNNQRELKNDIKAYFDVELGRKHNDILFKSTRFEKDHGRIEQRDYFISYDTSYILDTEKWKNVNAIGMVRVYKEINDELTIKDYYYIMDRRITMDFFMKATRNHWHIENKLHWMLDVVFDEDHQRSRTGHSIENLTLLRKIVFNLVRLDDSFDGKKLSLKKKLTTYNANFSLIEQLIFSSFPTLLLKINLK
jgi:predicted transposase YbfD/YdcC